MQKMQKVFFSSNNPTPELPLLEEAASELAALDDLDLLPAAAFDVDCHWAEETPATTLPATPQYDDSCSSVSDEQESAEDDKPSHSLVPLWPNAPQSNDCLCVINTFVELKQIMDEVPRRRSRAASEFTGLCELKAAGISEISIASFRQPKPDIIEKSPYPLGESMEFHQVPYVPMWCPVQCEDGMSYSGMQYSGGIVEWGASQEDPYNTEHVPIQCWPVIAPPTTLVLSHLPNELTQEDLIEVLDREEFSGLYDFVSLPTSNAMPHSRCAIVNLVSHDHGLELAARLHGKVRWAVFDSKCACDVTWNLPVQGLPDLIHTYRDSPENHPDVPEECRPQIFSGGWPVPFP